MWNVTDTLLRWSSIWTHYVKNKAINWFGIYEYSFTRVNRHRFGYVRLWLDLLYSKKRKIYDRLGLCTMHLLETALEKGDKLSNGYSSND